MCISAIKALRGADELDEENDDPINREDLAC